MLTSKKRSNLIENMGRLPDDLERVVNGLDAARLTAVTIAGEWTVAQNVHHVADSHLNAYIRMKLVLAEDHPTLKTYDQDVWAAMQDAQSANLTASLALIRGLHKRWVTMLEALDPEDESVWQRTAFHPENGTMTLDDLLTTYGNHGHGHIDQIERTLAAGR